VERLIDQLVQLQELYFADSEQRSLAIGGDAEELGKSIQALMSGLPPEIASLCERLRQRYLVVVGPVVDGACSACGVTLPTSQIYEIETGDKIYQCPSCSRILYSCRGAPRQLKRVGPIGKSRSGVARFSSPSLMCPSLKAETKEGALWELVHMIAKEGFVESPEALLEAALAREAIMTTAVHNGLAFPHVRGVEGGGLTFSLGLKRDGLEFGAPDGGLTQIIFFIVIPSAASGFYLQLLSGLIQALQDESARQTLLASATPAEVWENLTRLSQKTIP
jgi:mannitol/fructose-specific phosphotransferase system IIA component (Ntr-type)/DNA-directed RNA polymerase subunit RPC12/RpoP